MNVFNKVTIQSLKKNKTRTIVTIIGIMLSAAMICAVTTFVSSVQNYLIDSSIYSRGDWHGSTSNVDYETYMDIGNDKAVSQTTYSQILGYAKVDSKNEFKPYMYVIGADKTNYFESMPVHLISGDYPTNENEIIIPNHVLNNGGLRYKVGDTITLEIGDRQLDGFSMGQNNPFYTYVNGEEVPNKEEIEVETARTYTIVGIYERPSFEGHTAPGYTAITVADKAFGESTTFDVYFKMKNPADVYKFMEDRSMNGTTNNDVLMFMGVSQFGNFSDVLTGLAVIVIALIMFGSVSLIYNAFAISVSERTKQFGLLSSIGATKKQLRRMVLFEALAVSAIGIPLGIIAGIGGIGVTLLLIGDKFNSMVSGYPEPMRLCVSWEAIVVAIIVALITVLISAWIPSQRATKVSAVEAIRQNMDIKAKNKQVKTSKLTYKLFGLPGVIASKHYKRNKKKYRTTVISLFMSIVLFVSTAAFSDYLMESVTGGFESSEYDLSFVAHKSELVDRTADDILEILLTGKAVTKGAYSIKKNYSASVSDDYVTEEYIQSRGEDHGMEDGYNRVSGFLDFVNDSEFDKLLEQYGLNKGDYYNTEAPLAIAMDTNRKFNFTTEKYENIDTLKGDRSELICYAIKMFEGYEYITAENIDGQIFFIHRNPDNLEDEMKIPEEEGYVHYTLKSGKAITEKPYFMNGSIDGALNMIYPVSMYEYVLPKESRGSDLGYSYALCSDNHAVSYSSLETILLDNNLNAGKLYNVAEGEESTRNTVLIIQVFAYGFIVLISLIAAANVFNTISTNISLRRREFAMLKSVGMTQKGFNKMMNFECLLYGSKALLLGLPVSAGITYLIYIVVSGGFDTTYHLPWSAIGISVLSVFLVVFVTMLYSMSKIKKENPIDALKNENL